MLVGDYVEDCEVMVLFQALQMLGHHVNAVCLDRSQGDHVQTAVHDSDGAWAYSEKPEYHFILNVNLTEVRVVDYDTLLTSGGCAPEYLRLNSDVIKLV